MSIIDRLYYYDEEQADRAVNWLNSGIIVFVNEEWLGKQFRLTEWQEEFVRNIYGWRCKSDGSKRYKQAALIICKKLGKSFFAAALSWYELIGQGRRGQTIYGIATSRDQANNIFEPQQAIARFSPHLSPLLVDGTIKLHRNKTLYEYVDPSSGKLVGSGHYMACATDNKRLSLDGIIPTSMCIVDELHLFEDHKVFVALKNNFASQSSKNALMLYTSTMGDNDKTKPFYDIYNLCKTVEADPEFMPDFYPYLLEGKEKLWDDENEWLRVNPGLGDEPDSIKSLSKMRSLHQEAKASPYQASWFKRTQLNIMQGSVKSFVNLDVFDQGATKFTPKVLDMLKDYPCYLGGDFARSVDTNGVVHVWDVDGVLWVKPMCWIPEQKILDERDKVPYQGWADAGWLEVCPGMVADHNAIADYIKKQCDLWNVVEIDYDPACQTIMQGLYDDGYPCVQVLQTNINMSMALKFWEVKYLTGNHKYDGSPVFRWMVGNVRVDSNSKENLFPSKSKATGRIDLFTAMLNACFRIMPQEKDDEEPQVINTYDNREIREI